jgi:hypothetical protein
MFSRKAKDKFPFINGSRGRYLLVSAIIYLLVGASFLPVQHGDLRARFFDWMHAYFNTEPGILIGTLWLVSGLIMLFGAFQRRPHDRWAFAAAYTAPTMLMFCFVLGFWFTRTTEALVGAVVYVFFSLMSLVVSGMEGDEERTERLQHEHEMAERTAKPSNGGE